jgi:hypothetical protein
MNLILSHESVTVNGKSIPKIHGGFGIGQPSILAKQIADLHGYELREINQIINNNLTWFDEGIDFIDLKSVIIQDDHSVKDCLIKFYSKKGLSRSNYIYLFSQQGYAMLCKLLKSDLARQIYKQMVREYFRMVEIQQDLENSKEILSKQKGNISEGCWFSGKLAEIILEGIQQNREELNQLHLELRDLKEEVREFKKLSTGQPELSTREKSEPLPKLKSSVGEIKERETDSFIHKKQAEILQKIVNEKAKTPKERNRIWFEFKKQFGVTRYIHLPKSKYEEALTWLNTLF